MPGSYFDFSTTPINSDITLKAKWCGCGGGTPEDEIIAGFYQGNGARVTNVNGTVGYVHKNSYSGFSGNSAIPWYANPDFSGSFNVITPVQIKSVEFGQDGTEGLGYNAFAYPYYNNIEMITGSLTWVPEKFLFSGYYTAPKLSVKLEIPSTVTGTLQRFINNRGNACGAIIFNCPEGFVSSVDTGYNSVLSMLNLASSYANRYQTTEGFAIGGTLAGYVLANFPNQTGYRKLYKLT